MAVRSTDFQPENSEGGSLNVQYQSWSLPVIRILSCPQDAIAIVTGTMEGVYARKPRSNSPCLYQTTLKSVQLQRKPWTVPKVLFTLQGLQWQMCHQHWGYPQTLQVHDFGVNLSRSCLISYDVYTSHTYIICLFKSMYIIIYILYMYNYVYMRFQKRSELETACSKLCARVPHHEVRTHPGPQQ